MSRLLIVNADDFGLTPGVSAGILEAHRNGIVTSTSVLAVAPAFEETAPALRRAAHESGIGVGVHLAAVGEDPPLLPRSRVASLVDAETARFPSPGKIFCAAPPASGRPSSKRSWPLRSTASVPRD